MIHFVNPNYHVILIHYPLALLGLGLLIEIFGFLWPRSTFRTAGRWMILLGALATIPAATSGMFAKYDVIQGMSTQHHGTWDAVRNGAHLTAEQWRLLNDHVFKNAIASAVAVFAVILWLGGSDRWRRAVHIPVLLLLLGAMGIMTLGSYSGGEMISRTQFSTMSESRANDKIDKVQEEIHDKSDAKESRNAAIEYYISPLQAHVIGAGLVFAMAAAALGMSLRKSAHVRLLLLTEAMDVATADAVQAPVQAVPGKVVRTRVIDDELAPAPVERKTVVTRNTPAVVAVVPAPSPASRFWILAVVLGLLTAAGGWYVAFDLPTSLLDVKTDFLDRIWQPFYKDRFGNDSRVFIHLALGVGIIVLALLLAMVSRWGVRNRLVVIFLGLLMTAAIAAQLGMGTLMMYDTDHGPLKSFNAPESGAAVDNKRAGSSSSMEGPPARVKPAAVTPSEVIVPPVVVTPPKVVPPVVVKVPAVAPPATKP